MSKTITLRVDEHIKETAETMLEELGLNMTTYLNMSLKAFVRENQIPFALSVDPFYSEANQSRLRKAVADVESGRAMLTVRDLVEVEDD